MSYLLNATNEYLYGTQPWAGGNFWVSYWFRRPSGTTTNRRLWTIMDSAEAADETTASPRIYGATTGGPTTGGAYTNSGGTSSDDVDTTTYAAENWVNSILVFTASGYTISSVRAYMNGTASNAAGTGDRDMSEGAFNTLYIGSTSSNNSNSEFAEFAFYTGAPDAADITALQTTKPSGVRTDLLSVYWPLETNANAHATYGGASYNLTVNGTAGLGANHPTLDEGGASGVAAKAATYYAMLRS